MKLKRTNSDDPDFRRLVVDLDKYLGEVDGDLHSYYAQFNGIAEIPNVVVAYDDGQPVGCGAFKRYDDIAVEIKRMYVAPDQRGKKIGVQILNELESWAAELGFGATILETGQRQIAAIKLYQNSGYEIIPNYDQYAGVENSICMKKNISDPEKAAAHL
jgi:putative acetyltransferase